MNITSIATYLPSSTEHDDAAFAGTTLRQPLASSLSPVQEASLRAQQAENQSRDAEERKVAWSGEDAVHPNDIDGEGEDDPEYVRLPDGTYQRIRTHDSEVRSMAPVGMRTETGAIEPLMPSILEESEALFSGVSEPVLTRLQQLVRLSKNLFMGMFLSRSYRIFLDQKKLMRSSRRKKLGT